MTLVSSWRRRKREENLHQRRTELEFLPAALEIQETPPAPLARATAWSLILFFVVGVLWATFGWVDIVTVARGKLIPTGHSKVLQPLDAGIVRKILVEDGQVVRKDEPLIELDPTTPHADVKRLESEWISLEASLARLRALEEALKAGTISAEPFFAVPSSVPREVLAVQQRLLTSQYTAYLANDIALEKAIDKQHAVRASLKEEEHKLEQVLPLITKRARALKTLLAQQMAAEKDYLQLEQQRIETVQARAALKHRLTETAAVIDQARAERDALKTNFKQSLVDEQVKLETRLRGLEQELVKARARAERQMLRAPVAGVVQQLTVNTVGGVVTPAERLMVIVPKNRHLEIEAWIQNKDIGFIREGQRAEVKVDTFRFTKYGTLPAEIHNVSRDAVKNEQLGWVYMARVAPEQTKLKVNGHWVKLMPGMAVTVEVKTGKRRLIEYFLSPLLRYQDESVRER